MKTPRSTAPSVGPVPEGAAVFATTHWSVVLDAGANETTRAQVALTSLCRAYWYPLYAYVRRRGYTAPDAQDLTQEFFARLLHQNWLQQADRQRGKFRADRQTAKKISGHNIFGLSGSGFDAEQAESQAGQREQRNQNVGLAKMRRGNH